MLKRMESAPRRYTEWAAPAVLRDSVACLWSAVATDDAETLVLPDACSDLIWEQGRGVFVAGPDTGPNPAASRAGTVTFGVRFRPAAGGPALGLPLSELRDQRVDLADLYPAAARRLPGHLDLRTAVTGLVDLAGRLVADGAPDPAVAAATRMLSDPRVRSEDVADRIGLSMRQLRRRSHDAVGYGPKTLQRVIRFRRFVSRIDAGHRDLAAIAADVGYADQAHLTRECVRLSGLTPAALARVRSGE
jgi:AraC-like DNA-binding protein